ALLDAGRALVSETGRPPTLSAVALRAGMARASVYEYFHSGEDLLAALAEDITPRWTARLREQMSAAATAAAAPGHITGERAAAMHQALVEPLSEALGELGAEPVAVITAAIDGMVRATARTIEEGTPLDVAWPAARRLLEPFLAGHAG